MLLLDILLLDFSTLLPPLLYHYNVHNYICIEFEDSVDFSAVSNFPLLNRVMPVVLKVGTHPDSGKMGMYIYSNGEFCTIYRLFLRFTKMMESKKIRAKAAGLSTEEKKSVLQLLDNLSSQTKFTIAMHIASNYVPPETIKQLQTAPGLVCELKSAAETSAIVFTTSNEEKPLLQSLRSLTDTMKSRKVKADADPKFPFSYKPFEETFISMCGSYQYFGTFILALISILLFMLMVKTFYFGTYKEDAASYSDYVYVSYMKIWMFFFPDNFAESSSVIYWYLRSLLDSESTEIPSSVGNQRLGHREQSQNNLESDNDYYDKFHQSDTDFYLSFYKPYEILGDFSMICVELVRFPMTVIPIFLTIFHPYVSEDLYKILGAAAFVFKILLVLKQALSVCNKSISCFKVYKAYSRATKLAKKKNQKKKDKKIKKKTKKESTSK